jgi:hypothetical protein
MPRRVHYEVEVLYGTVYQPLCEQGRDAIGSSHLECEMTTDDREVTCKRCLKALGYEAAPIEQLTVCEPDPMRRAA